MQPTRKLWQWLGFVFLLSFAALGWLGREIYLAAPPIPKAVVGADGRVLFTRRRRAGRPAGMAVRRRPAARQRLGSRQLRRARLVGRLAASRSARAARAPGAAIVAARLRVAHRGRAGRGRCGREDARCAPTPTTPTTGTLRVSPERTRAIESVAAHYRGLFGDAPALTPLRDQYAMSDNVLPQAADRHALTAFFFWSSWSAATDRPGESGLSYTSNWPHEPLVGNTLTTGSAMWSIVSHHPADRRHRGHGLVPHVATARRRSPPPPSAIR